MRGSSSGVGKRPGAPTEALAPRTLAAYPTGLGFTIASAANHGGLTVIEALKSDEIVEKLGGRFKLTALIQRRLGEIIQGARPLVEREGRSDLEVVIEEILQDKITVDWEASGLPEPTKAKGR